MLIGDSGRVFSVEHVNFWSEVLHSRRNLHDEALLAFFPEQPNLEQFVSTRAHAECVSGFVPVLLLKHAPRRYAIQYRQYLLGVIMKFLQTQWLNVEVSDR